MGDEATIIWDLIEKKLILKKPNEEQNLADNNQDFNVSLTYQMAMLELIQCIGSKMQTSQPLLEGIKTTELLFQCKNM